jgi:prophage regulatory protein
MKIEYPDSTPRTMLNVGQVAELLGCSERHAYRLVSSGTMPRPVKLGQLNRWPRSVIEHWIAEGCPAVKKLTSISTSDKKGGDHE